MAITKGSKIEVQVRIVGGKGATDWASFGTFYVDNFRLEETRLSLECFDAMMRADTPFLKTNEASANYPITSGAALQRISDVIGVPLDPRNNVSGGMAILFPQNLSVREVLGFIASAHGSNAYITDDNYLRIVTPQNGAPLYSITPSTTKRVLLSGSRMIDELQMQYLDRGDIFVAGGGSSVLKVFNLFATQELTDKAFGVIKSYLYNSFAAESAEFDPALEFGDAIEVKGISANVWAMKWSTRLYCDVSAPTVGETERDFTGSKSNALARLSQEDIVQLDHLPKQTEIDAITNEAAVFVYDKNNPFNAVDDRVDVPTDVIVVKGMLYPVTDVFVRREVLEYPPEPPQPEKDFAFVIYGTEYGIGYLDGEELNFTIDWGDGTQSIVTSTDEAQRTHTYAAEQEWTIAIKNYVSGWIDFGKVYNFLAKMKKILTPFPENKNRASFEYCFNGHRNLESIPENLFAKNSNATNFMTCFGGCDNLTTIPENLFANNSDATNFNACFAGCRAVTSIPENLFAKNLKAIEFNACFSSCGNITTVPEKLFANNADATYFNGCFSGCSLSSIPENLFAKNLKVITFGYCFQYGYTGNFIPAGLFANNLHVISFEYAFGSNPNLTTIPENLFANNTDVESFRSCFSRCYQLSAIPEKLFASNPKVTDFYGCFNECENLKNIPENLFASNLNVTNFGSCFDRCTSITSIPENLFINNLKVTNFGYCFARCAALTEIPENLFANHPNVTSFLACFYQCASLVTVPRNLFANNSNVTGFQQCFRECVALQDINLKIHSDVLARNTNYDRMFQVTSAVNSAQGYAPELWKSATTTASYKSQCFRHNTALLNYDDIPAAWK